MCLALLKREPRSAGVLTLLGGICGALGERPEAIDHLRRALAIEPRNPGILYNLGNILRESGRVVEAIEVYRCALNERPAFVEAWMNLALAYGDCGRIDDAIGANSHVLGLLPRDPRAYYNHGNLQYAAGRFGEAVASFQSATILSPSDPVIAFNLGNAQLAAANLVDAIGSFERTLRLKPNFVAALINLGRAYTIVGRSADALATYRRALDFEPDNPVVLMNLGNALRHTGMLDEAITAYRQSLALDSGFGDAHYNLAIALQECGLDTEARTHYERSLALAPARYAGAEVNLGIIFANQGSIEAAAECYERALAIDPGDAECRLNRALLRLSEGNFQEGWRDFEARLELGPRAGLAAAPLERRWRGQVPTTELLVVAEQGLGDTIQFARYGALLRDRGIRAILQCDAGMTALLRTGNLFDRVVPHTEAGLIATREWCPLLSLPLIFGTVVSTIPSMAAYLQADAELVDVWSRRLGAREVALRVGIAWQGNPAAERRGLRGRSFPLHCAGPLIELPDIQVIVLQKGQALGQLQALNARDRVVCFGDSLDDGPDAFLETAALMLNLDLVVTSDTAIAHLAGALGVPVWVALHNAADWRWLRGRSDTPWYPSMRLFRQGSPGDWNTVFTDMANQLVRLRSNR